MKLSEHVAAAIKHRTSYQNPLAAGYATLQSLLQQSASEEQLHILFEAEKRGLTGGAEGQQQLAMWQPLLGLAQRAWPPTGQDPESVLCAGSPWLSGCRPVSAFRRRAPLAPR